MEKVPAGVYRHYKGGDYRVIETAAHEETGERLVVYRSLLSGETFARPADVFLGSVRVDGVEVPRFASVCTVPSVEVGLKTTWAQRTELLAEVAPEVLDDFATVLGRTEGLARLVVDERSRAEEAESLAESRRKELLRVGLERQTEWKRAEKAEAERDALEKKARLLEEARARADERRREAEFDLGRAVRTLTSAGYTDSGGSEWRPPLGPDPSPLLVVIEMQKARIERLLKAGDRLQHLAAQQDVFREAQLEWLNAAFVPVGNPAPGEEPSHGG